MEFDQLITKLLTENEAYDPGANERLVPKDPNYINELVQKAIASMLQGKFSSNGLRNTDVIPNLKFNFPEGEFEGTHFLGGNFKCKLNIKPQNVVITSIDSTIKQKN